MTLAALSIDQSAADAALSQFRHETGLRGELKGSRINLQERALLFNILNGAQWTATVGIAISALKPEPGEDRGDHDVEIYAALLDDVVGAIIADGGMGCGDVIIDDGRYGTETLALVRNAVGRLVGPLGTANLAVSHMEAGLQLADVIANTFFNRALPNDRQAQMAAIVAPHLESGRIAMRILPDG